MNFAPGRLPSSKRRFHRKTPTGRKPRLEALEARHLLAGEGIFISEFTAANSSGLLDQFGNDSDWLELHNPSDSAVSLEGWHLTDVVDEPTKWTFPSVAIEPRGYLVVFASGQDLKDPQQTLHTNFRLSSSGDYVGLVRPDMTVAHAFAPEFPEQFSDISYGLPSRSTSLIADDASFSYHVPEPADSALGIGWAETAFDDTNWIRTAGVPISAGIGYAAGDAVIDDLIVSDVESEIFLKNASLWMRQELQIEDPTQVDALLLRVQFDDGFVAFLNGGKVAASNAPEDVSWDSAALDERPDEDIRGIVEFDISQHVDRLVSGKNVLAVQALNSRAFDSDLLVRPSLVALQSAAFEAGTFGYLVDTTPGRANSQGRGGVVTFSQQGATFVEPLTITLSTTDPNQVIRYTTDGSVPNESSQVYTESIVVESTVQIRAAAMLPNGGLGPVAGESFIHVADDARHFSSALPIIVLENFGQRRISARATSVNMTLFEPDPGTGRVTFGATPEVSTRLAISVRGQSSSGFPKRQYRLETQNQQDQDEPMSLLGMPADADWVLIAPWSDKALIRNTFAYDLGQQIGLLAPRTRHVEVFLSDGGESLSAEHYVGVYALAENIKIGEDRVDIVPLGPTDTTEPNIAGGYLMRFENEVSVAADRISSIEHLELVDAHTYTTEQREWISNHIDLIDATIKGDDFTDPEIGYAKYIDVESFINIMAINELTRDQDSYVRSNYLHKDRDGKLTEGPLWDYNLITDVGCCFDNRNPRGWQHDQGYSSSLHGWFNRLIEDPDFAQRFIDRYAELRRDEYSITGLHSLIDMHADPISEAAQRNFERWDIFGSPAPGFPSPVSETWEQQIDNMKRWVVERTDWIDDQFLDAPRTVTSESGNAGEVMVTIEGPEAAMIYYTLDGSDPRGRGAAIQGQLYEGPFAVPDGTQIISRVHDSSLEAPARNDFKHIQWSAPTSKIVTSAPIASAGNLVVSEFNYHPLAAQPQLNEPEVDKDEFEFMELLNVGDQAIELEGVQLVESPGGRTGLGVRFEFQQQTLEPGQRIVIVENVEAFRGRYGNAVTLGNGKDNDGPTGQYGGRLSNEGDRVTLLDRFGQLIQTVGYGTAVSWPARANGQGSSLELVDVRGDLSDPSNWRPSSAFGGTPGVDGGGRADDIVVNEVVVHSDAAMPDMIELHNTTGQPIQLLNWFLSTDPADPFQFQFTTPTTIPPLGYLTLSQSEGGFDFSPGAGGALLLTEANESGEPQRFVHRADFPPTLDGVPLGRLPNATGEFLPMAELTLGAGNSEVRAGDVTISEVQYAPLDLDGEGGRRARDFKFVELYNRTGQQIDLGGWRIKGNAAIEFETGTVIEPQSTLVIVRFRTTSGTNSTIFRFSYSMDANAPLVGRFDDEFEPDGGSLRLERPGNALADGSVPMVWVDEVQYSSETPWPSDVVETNRSLTRVAVENFGPLPSSWVSRPSSPGRVEFFSRIPGDSNDDGNFNADDITRVLTAEIYGTGQPATWSDGDWTGDGVFDALDIVVALQEGGYSA